MAAEWINRLEASGLAAKTIANKHGFLVAMFKAAVAAEKIRRNPYEGMRLPRNLTPEMVFLTRDRFAQLHDAMTERFPGVRADAGRVGCTVRGNVRADRRRHRSGRLHRADQQGVEAGRARWPDSRAAEDAEIAAYVQPSLRAGKRSRSRPSCRSAAVRESARRTDPVRGVPPSVDCFDPESGAAGRNGRVVTDRLKGKRPRPHDLRHTCASWPRFPGSRCSRHRRRQSARCIPG